MKLLDMSAFDRLCELEDCTIQTLVLYDIYTVFRKPILAAVSSFINYSTRQNADVYNSARAV